MTIVNNICTINTFLFLTTQHGHHKQSVHGGVKNTCEKCEYEATDHGNLKKHLQFIHGGVIYACDK